MQLRSLSAFHGVSPACLGVSLPTILIALLSVMVAGCNPSTLFTPPPAPLAESSPESPDETIDFVSPAIAQATAAANLTQTADSWEEWHRVTQHWQEAIAQLKTIPKEHPQQGFASEKILEYQRNLTYAHQQFDRLDPLKPALNIGYRASQLTRVAETKPEWDEGIQTWQQAIAHLKAIPLTYPQSARVQDKLVEYQRNLTFSEQQQDQFHPLYQGLAKAEAATQLAKTASTLEQWEAVALLWKQALAIVTSISPTDDKAALAAPKRNEYERNLTDVQQQIARLDPYNQALVLVEQARTLEKTANSMAEWEAVRGEWQKATAGLEKVPTTHPKSVFAQQLLAESQLSRAYAQQQVQQTDPFDQALATAERARQLTESAFSLYDWNAIASQWQEAIAHLEQVPLTHPKHSVVAQTITTYQTALNNAIRQSQQRLQPVPTAPASMQFSRAN